VIYHYQGEKTEGSREQEAAEACLTAADYWKRAISIAPNNYLEAQNWLKTTGRLHEFLKSSMMKINFDFL